MSDELMHYGIKGMKWGVRRMAKKDAKRHAEAKMFYGKTAGTKRKLLKAELENKKKKISGYEEEFNKALENVDYAKAAKKAVRTRKKKDIAYRTRITTKQFLGVTGPLTVAAASHFYQRNREEVNAFIARNLNVAYASIKRGQR